MSTSIAIFLSPVVKYFGLTVAILIYVLLASAAKDGQSRRISGLNRDTESCTRAFPTIVLESVKEKFNIYRYRSIKKYHEQNQFKKA
jgi:hypothetical protein